MRRAVLPAITLAMGGLCYPLRAMLPSALLRAVLPDFLWAFAFAWALAVFTKSPRWLLVGFGVAELLEIAQIHPAFPGTFDPLDLVAIAVGFALAAAQLRMREAPVLLTIEE